MLNNNNINIGRNRLFTILRDNGYLIKVGKDKNMPKQVYVKQGLFKVAESVVKNLIKADVAIKSAKVAILGFTFKENCPDTRNTRIIDIVNELKEYGINVYVSDPLADREEVLNEYNINNDKTLMYLGRIALSHANAGADMVAPSDMMDGRIEYIRRILDENGYESLPIMSYAAKYSSAFYGPFREAAGSAPSFGDRKGYQMDPANSREAMAEIEADLNEGADIIMVKPAMSYLDIVREARDKINAPICVYNVSGEYAMVKNAGEAGLINEKLVALEMLLSMKRAGAKMIITYYAIEAAKWLKEDN